MTVRSDCGLTSIGAMTYNITKLIVAAVLAVVLVIAMLVDSDSASWAAPLLALLVGYVVGNASVTGNAPIVSTEGD